MTLSHTIVILLIPRCLIEHQETFSCIDVIEYKTISISITSTLYSNEDTLIRINSTSVHTYICVYFIQNIDLSNIQHITQNVSHLAGSLWLSG